MIRINGERKQEERIIIYYCDDCGIMEYEYKVVNGGKVCPGGCGYFLNNEEAGE